MKSVISQTWAISLALWGIDMLLTASDVANRLKVSAKTVWRLVDSGRLAAVRLTPSRRGWRFTEAAVDAAIGESECRSESAADTGSLTLEKVRSALDARLGPVQMRSRLRPNCAEKSPALRAVD